jgi:hypothetical protein
MKGQSGAMLLLGYCAVLFKSNKQKVNTSSSTEAELIAIDDACQPFHGQKFHASARV